MNQLTTLIKQKNACTVCRNENLEEIIQLPHFPFTGIYCDEDHHLPDYISTGIDQGVHYCSSCQHVQLKNIIDPHLVYDHTYTHRGSKSNIARGGNDFFSHYVKTLFPNICFHSIVDIGCNDGYLLSKLESIGDHLLGIDPIWIGKDHSFTKNISVVGGFIEDMNLNDHCPNPPELIVSAHTFEHIENPRNVLESIVAQVKPGTKFVIEVPSLDTLVNNYRFDQIFHQHLQYFSQHSFLQMIQELGCKYIDHTFNYSMWGGTMLFAFEKGMSVDTPQFKGNSKEDLLNSYRYFLRSLHQLSQDLESSDSKFIYGFGAAQMLPTLAYHMPCHLSKIHAILDDDPSRQGLMYPNMTQEILSPNTIDFTKSDIVITALDSARPILSKLIGVKSRRILLPIQVI